MAQSPIKKVTGKVKRTFTLLDHETIGGLLLILATIIALIIANSPLEHAYHEVLIERFVIGTIGEYNINLSIHHWINDGLMVIFFVVAGLEIKREILVGELSSKQKAAMPLMAALGGMVVPALVFFALNVGKEAVHGWAIPMATDIAYAIGIMGLLERRIPVQLKIFLVALAIADDIGAILVIALFYSSDISWLMLAIAAGLYGLLFLFNIRGVKRLTPYILVGLVFWGCFLYSGIHATIAGVLFAFAIPVGSKFSAEVFREKFNIHRDRLEKEKFAEYLNPLVDTGQQDVLRNIGKDIVLSQPALIRLENSLHGFNSYVVIPIFALANAGVRLDVGITELFTQPLGLGIILGLGIGKVLGIVSFSYLGSKTGWATLPQGVNWKHTLGMGFIAGIGFTMSLFITNLAFADDPQFVKISKISILLASFIAGVIGITILLMGKKPEEGHER